jgi:hypothetical protein
MYVDTVRRETEVRGNAESEQILSAIDKTADEFLGGKTKELVV